MEEFINSILENPKDEFLRLVFADLLEEKGMWEQSIRIRENSKLRPEYYINGWWLWGVRTAGPLQTNDVICPQWLFDKVYLAEVGENIATWGVWFRDDQKRGMRAVLEVLLS